MYGMSQVELKKPVPCEKVIIIKNPVDNDPSQCILPSPVTPIIPSQ